MTYLYRDTDGIEILDLIVAKLRADLNLNDRRCYLTMPDLDFGQMPPGGDYWLEVSPGGNRAPEDWQTGGGRNQVVAENVFNVDVYNRVKLDSANKIASLLTAYRRGLMRIESKVISSLVDWLPQDTNGNYLCVNPVRYVSTTAPRYDATSSVSRLTVMFGVDFDIGGTLDAALEDE